MRYDIAVIGGGLLGLATARELLQRHPGLGVVVLERERELAMHQSGRNSGVIHAGIYYRPGSLKAQLCVAGMRSMIQYCRDRGVEVRQCGKLIVATREDELPRLRELFERGRRNGVPGLELVGPERIRELEPHCVGLAAVFSPATGIVDFAAVARAYADDVRAAGGEISLDWDVRRLTVRSDVVAIEGPRGEIAARWVVGCAGLWADRVAELDGGPAEPRPVPFRGTYWRLIPARRHLVRALIYPVPDPAFPFLGVHFTPRIDGDVWLGPNAILALARDGYSRSRIAPRDLIDIARDRGFWRFAARHWRTGFAELARDLSRARLVAELQRYVPELRDADIAPGPAGVRAQPLTPSGELIDDFVIDVTRRGIHVRHAPSPAATASLEIARVIADRVGARLASAASPWSTRSRS